MQKTQNDMPATQANRDPFQSLFHRIFGETWPELGGAVEANRAPLVNISENEKAYEFAFELPGLAEDDIHVNLQDGTLTVTAERKDDRDRQGRKWHRVEHRYGRFARAISLPKDAANTGIEAIYKHGVLTIAVPKAPEAQPTRIQVRGS